MHGYGEWYWLGHHWHWVAHGWHWAWLIPCVIAYWVLANLMRDRREAAAAHRNAMFPGGCPQRLTCKRRDSHRHLTDADYRALNAKEKER